MSPRRNTPRRAQHDDRQAASSAVSAPAVPTAPLTVTATDAQNQFGQLLDSAARDRVVVITRHNAPRAVLLSFDRYNALAGAGAAALDSLTSEFDAVLERLQSKSARAALDSAFNASTRELGRAAVAAARPRARDRTRGR